MENALFIALSNQLAIRRHMDVIANNVANANTAGYRGEEMMFVEYLVPTETQGEMAFVQDYAVVRDFREGGMTRTGNTYDMAIHGKGWFEVDTPTGLRYTRDGNFHLDTSRTLVSSANHPVLGDNGTPITIPVEAATVLVGRDGTVSADGTVVGRIKVAAFADEQLLTPEGSNMYRSDAPPIPAENVTIVQGMIEGANVKPVIQMANMVKAMGDYRAAQQIIDEEHERQQNVISTLTDTTSA